MVGVPRAILPAFAAMLIVNIASNAWAAPAISHIPPVVPAKGNILIRAKITAVGGVQKPYLYFRKAGAPTFARINLIAAGGGKYQAWIPVAALKGAKSVEYYLGATAGKDHSVGFWRSKENPHSLRLPEPKKPSVHVKTIPAKALVAIDGDIVGPSPFISTVEPGPHHAMASLPGFDPATVNFKMAPGKDFNLILTLHREKKPKPAKIAKGGSELDLELPAPPIELAPFAVKPRESAPVARATPKPPPPTKIEPAPAPVTEAIPPEPPPSPIAEATPPEPPTTEPAQVPVAVEPAPPPPAPVAQIPAVASAPVPPPIVVSAPPAIASPPAPIPPPIAGQGHIRIVTDPPLAAINLDGRDLGNSPITVNLPPGAYLLTAKVESFRRGSRVVHVVADEDSDRFLKLRPEAPIR